MPLEDLTGPSKFIGDLVREWPLGIDPYAEGDDHIRGLKNVILNTFGSLDQLYDVSDAAYKSEANVFTGTNDFNGAVSAFAALLQSGANPGPALQLLQENASPAAADLLAQVAFEGRNSSAAQVKYAELLGAIVNPTNAVEDGELVARALSNGSVQEILRAGKGLYMNGATAGDMGLGTINAQGYFENGVAAQSQRALDETIISTPTPDYVLSWNNADDWRKIELSLTELACQTNGAFVLTQSSENGGSTFHSAYDYRRADHASTYGTAGAQGAPEIPVCGGLRNTDKAALRIEVHNPGTARPGIFWELYGILSSGALVRVGGGADATASTEIDAIRVYFSGSNNIATANIKASAYK